MSVCVRERSSQLKILPLRQIFRPPPCGSGNAAILDESVRQRFARELLDWLQELQREQRLTIHRIGIDASSDYCRDASGRRPSERLLNEAGIHCFATPTEEQFRQKIDTCRSFLRDGGPANRLPNANLLWMLVGFELFRTLEKVFECLETYPQAIVRTLRCDAGHKSTAAGYEDQLAAAARLWNVSCETLAAELKTMGYGSRHDRLDAFFSAFVASLPRGRRRAYGTPPRDAIWVPKV